MALVKSLKNKIPNISSNVYLAENATIIGDVTIKDNSSIWFNAVVRGDVNSILIGENVNIQDGVIIHCTFKKTKTVIGNNVSIGHGAIIHGCEIANNVLIGMGAVIMDGVKIQEYSIIAAGAVVTQNTIVKSGEVFSGVPASLLLHKNKNDIYKLTSDLANNYIKYSSWYR